MKFGRNLMKNDQVRVTTTVDRALCRSQAVLVFFGLSFEGAHSMLITFT